MYQEPQSVSAARAIIARRIGKGRPPIVVKYSGGKDSTLLCQLTLEARDRAGSQQKIFVMFNDTTHERPSYVERVERVGKALENLPNVSFIKTVPPVKYRVLPLIIGKGYPAPNFRFRYCQKYLKIDPTLRAYKGLRDEYGEGQLVAFLGRRKAESINRKTKLEKLNAPYYCTRIVDGVYEGDPIADVGNDELWQYLNHVGTFVWGDTVEELAEYYKRFDRTRFGCWLCTFQQKERGGTTARDIFREYLREINVDKEKRNVTTTERQEERLKNGEASGRFTDAARTEILYKILELEREYPAEAPIISDDELNAIYDYWEEEASRRQGEFLDGPCLMSILKKFNRDKAIQ